MWRKRGWLAEPGDTHGIVPCVELQAQGMKAKQIAQRLDLGERTVEPR